jgi:hypothetical protein
MVPTLKRPALMILALTLWVGGADSTRAAPPVNRSKFVEMLADQQIRVIANQLKQNPAIHPFGAQVSQNPPPSSVLVKLQQLDQNLQQRSTRIQQRLTSLNNLLSTTTNPGRLAGLEQLKTSLTRQEATVMRQIQSVQQRERQVGTPSAPGF